MIVFILYAPVFDHRDRYREVFKSYAKGKKVTDHRDVFYCFRFTRQMSATYVLLSIEIHCCDVFKWGSLHPPTQYPGIRQGCNVRQKSKFAQ